MYSELIGPIYPTDIFSNKYIITFLDSKTRYLEIELLETKDQALKAFKKYKTRNEISNNKTFYIKLLKANNKRKYINNNFTKYLESIEIVYTPSAPYTPEQNGRAERINQTLF